MKFNSKILCVLLALLAVGAVISSASAVDLVNGLNNEDFKVAFVSGANFTQSVNIAQSDMNLMIFENSGNKSDDVNSMIYFRHSAGGDEIDSFIKDLEKSGTKVEETDKYVVLKNTQNFSIDEVGDLEGIFNMAGDLLPSGDGLNISADGNSISLSSKGLEVSDSNGTNVSITSDGVKVSGDDLSGNETVDVSASVDSNIKDSDYSIYLKNQANDKVIVISGNNLELLKAMAETVSFNGN